jgi:signal transduction histidine kinase
VTGPFWSRLSLRWRLMVIGVSGLTVSLLVAGWLLLAVLGWAFDRSVDASARQTAADLAGLIDVGQLPQPVPVAGTQLVQVVDGRLRVRAGSPGADRLVPLLQPNELSAALTGRQLEIDGSRAGVDGPLRVSAIAAGPDSDRLSVIIAAPLGDVREAVVYLRVALLVLFVPLVSGLAVVAWWAIGRTLQPVESLRAGAEEITGQADAEQRLPVPAGEDEIHRLAVTLNGMLDRLGSARRRQRQFVADAAHELRNPLAGMRTQLEVARRHPSGTHWPELVDDLLLDTDRLASMADDLLLLARADEGAAARSPVPVSVPEVLLGVVARYRSARVPVHFQDDNQDDNQDGDGRGDGGGELLVRADPEDLHRILTNLVDNAVRHARTGVRLTAAPAPVTAATTNRATTSPATTNRATTTRATTTRATTSPATSPATTSPATASPATGSRVRITVTDDGPGIPEADRSRVFARFTRLDDARVVDEGGAGLGLAIVADLVHRQGGTIELEDAGPGLRAELTLPGCDQAPPARA